MTMLHNLLIIVFCLLALLSTVVPLNASSDNDGKGTYVYTPPDSGEKGDSIIDDDDKGAGNEVDKDAVIDDDDKGASKKVDQDAVTDDDD